MFILACIDGGVDITKRQAADRNRVVQRPLTKFLPNFSLGFSVCSGNLNVVMQITHSVAILELCYDFMMLRAMQDSLYAVEHLHSDRTP
jgi:hypothetical protein